MKSNSAINWLRKIFNIQRIGTIAGIIAACIATLEYFENNEGTIVALVNNAKSNTPVERNVLVYLDQKTIDLKQLNLLPQILNPSKFAVKDIYVKYAIKSHNANIDYTDYYSIHRVADKTELDIKDKTLYAQTELPEAFNAIILKDNSSIDIKLRTTYQGAEQPYEYDARITAKRIWHNDDAKRKQLILEDAYQYVSNQALNSVDIYIMKGEFANIMINVSPQQLQALSTTGTQQVNPQIKTPAKAEQQTKSVSSIHKESKDSIQNIKEETSTPWYVWLIGIVLLIMMTIAFGAMCLGAVVSFDKNETSKNRLEASLGLIIASITLYICIYFFAMCLNGTDPFKFIAGLVCYYILTFSTGVTIIGTEILKNKFKLKDDDFIGGLIFLLMWLTILTPTIFAIANLYALIPF